MTISKDRVKPSPLPDSWKLAEIFTTGIILGSYLAMMTVIFFWAAYKTNFFPVSNLHVDYLQLHVVRDQNVPLNYLSLELILVFAIFQHTFGVSSLQKREEEDFRKLASAVYLQVSTISQALIFVTRSRSWSFVERPGLLLVTAFVIAQLVSSTSNFRPRNITNLLLRNLMDFALTFCL